MRRYVITVAMLASLVALGSFAAAPRPAGTLQDCAALLPKGKTYTFSMTGTIDTSGDQPQITGNFTSSDDTKVDRSQEGAAFGKCFASLVQ